MGWTDRGSNPAGRQKFPAPIQTGPQDYTASCTMGFGVFPGDMMAEAWHEPTTPSSVEVKERVDL
jgi:hypothetical protein